MGWHNLYTHRCWLERPHFHSAMCQPLDRRCQLMRIDRLGHMDLISGGQSISAVATAGQRAQCGRRKA